MGAGARLARLNGYLPATIYPMRARMEFDQLLVREQASNSVFSYWFKPEPFSMKTHCLWSYPKILAYLPIVKPLRMEFDQLLIREKASIASHLRTHSTP